MFQLSYKAGWSKEHQVFGVYNTKDEARKAARSIPKKPKVWSIRVEEITIPRMLRDATNEEITRFIQGWKR